MLFVWARFLEVAQSLKCKYHKIQRGGRHQIFNLKSLQLRRELLYVGKLERYWSVEPAQ